MITGKVKFAHPAGWGFLVVDETSEEAYWHISNVVGRRALEKDQVVSFELVDNASGRGAAKQAIRIAVL